MKNNRNLRAFSLIEISIVVLIIGILIVGVTQSSRLVAQAKVNSARTLTQSSPASSIDGLMFWVESSSPQESFSNEDIEDTDTITIWNDINPQNSNRNNLTGTFPTYSTDGINAIPALTFDGTDDALSSANFANISTGTVSVFAVIRLPASLANGTIVSKGTNFELKATSTGTWEMCGGGTCYASTASATANASYIVSAIYNNTSSANDTSGSEDTLGGVNIFQNGVNIAQTDTTTSLSASANSLTVGNVATGTDDFLEGNLGEVIVYDRSLKQEERQSIEEYLSKKWGIRITTETF